MAWHSMACADIVSEGLMTRVCSINDLCVLKLNIMEHHGIECIIMAWDVMEQHGTACNIMSWDIMNSMESHGIACNKMS